MSFRIYWDRVGEEQAEKARVYINNFFQSVPKPEFIGDIAITALSLGDKAPDIRLIDIADPPAEVTGANPSSSSSSSSSTSRSPMTPDEGAPKATDMDIMIKVFLEYSGTAKLTMRVLISLVNWPRPRTVCLPVTFTLSNFHFEGVACAIHHGGKVFFCFDKRENDEVGPLKSLKIEAEIGDSSQQVLKNLEKVETFIVDMLKKLIKDRLIFPNVITILDSISASSSAPAPAISEAP